MYALCMSCHGVIPQNLFFLKLRSLRPKEAKLYIVCTVRRSQSKHTASPRRAPPAAIAANTIAARHQRASDDQNAHLNDWRSSTTIYYRHCSGVPC